MNSLTHARLPREDSHELQCIQPFTNSTRKGKERATSQEEGEVSDEIDQLADSDDDDQEIEGLLPQTQESTTENETEGGNEEGEGGRGNLVASDLRSERKAKGRGKAGKDGWKAMNSGMRKRFLREMLVEVSERALYFRNSETEELTLFVR